MKVLHINATYGNGSTGSIVQDIQKLCIDQGFECYAAYANTALKKDQIVNGYRIGNNFNHKLHSVLSRLHGKQGYFSSSATKELLSWIESIHPNVVHLHNLHSSYVNLNMLLDYLAKKDIATVVTLHDCWFYSGGCTHYTFIDCNAWKGKCGKCPKERRDFPAFLSNKSEQILADRKTFFNRISHLHVIGVSMWITGEAQKGVFRNRPCSTIYNGIDLEIFKPKQSNIRQLLGIEGKYVILGPASKWLQLENKKLYDELVTRLDDSTVFVLLGCPTNTVVPKGVIAYPYTSSKEELAEVYSSADVFVNCTHEESMSLINVEAQACGSPLVCYANTGAKETVNTRYGRLVKTNDVEGMLQSIAEIRKQTMSKEDKAVLHDWVAKYFEKKKNYEQYLNLYKSLVYEHQ